MKSRHVKPTLALLLVLGVSFVVAVGLAVAAVHVLDWRVIGSGAVSDSCNAALAADCTLTSSGSASESPQVLGTHIGNSSYTLTVETGLLSLDTSSAATAITTPPGPGLCFAASGTGTVTAANGDVINFNTVALLCEEAASGSALQYNGTYRITGGTGRFAAAVGGGSLTATFTKVAPVVAFIKIDGVINF